MTLDLGIDLRRYRPVLWLSYARDYNGRWQMPWDHIWQLALAAKTWLLYGENKKSSKLLYNTDKLFNSILQKYVGYESLACEHAWISCLFFVLDQPIMLLYIFSSTVKLYGFCIAEWTGCVSRMRALKRGFFPMHKPGFGCQCHPPDLMSYQLAFAAFCAFLMVWAFFCSSWQRRIILQLSCLVLWLLRVGQLLQRMWLYV